MLRGMSWFERLTSLDFTFLNLEDRSAHMHVAGLAVFDGTPPPYDQVLRLIDSRLDRVPRYRQRLQLLERARDAMGQRPETQARAATGAS